MTTLHVLRVFVDENAQHGNPLGVFLSGSDVLADKRQAVAADLGFSETVFVDDVRTGELRIFTPTVELPLAGHPLVGTAWLMDRSGHSVEALRPPAGRIPVRTEERGRTWISADPATSPKWELHQMRSAADVEGLNGDPTGGGKTVAWAWLDEPTGSVRVRVFGAEYGVPEDPATGSAALVLTAHLKRDLTIVQGPGSVIHARPSDSGIVHVGGRCVLDEERDYRVDAVSSSRG